MTIVVSHYTPSAEDSATEDATTTMGKRQCFAPIARTVGPERRDAVPPRAVRLAGSRPKYVAWSQIRSTLPGVRVTLDYDLELEVADESPLASELDRITSAAAESVVQFTFIHGTQAEAVRQPRTELGKRLLEFRRRIIASGAPLLDWDGLEREVRSRRGGVYPEDPA